MMGEETAVRSDAIDMSSGFIVPCSGKIVQRAVTLQAKIPFLFAFAGHIYGHAHERYRVSLRVLDRAHDEVHRHHGPVLSPVVEVALPASYVRILHLSPQTGKKVIPCRGVDSQVPVRVLSGVENRGRLVQDLRPVVAVETAKRVVDVGDRAPRSR